MFHPRRFQHFQLQLHFGREICHLFLGCCSFLDGLLSSPHWLQLDSLPTKRGFFPDNVSDPEFSIYFLHAMNVFFLKKLCFMPFGIAGLTHPSQFNSSSFKTQREAGKVLFSFLSDFLLKSWWPFIISFCVIYIVMRTKQACHNLWKISTCLHVSKI